MSLTNGTDVELLDALMRRFEKVDRDASRVAARVTRLEATDRRVREGLRQLAHHMRIACDAVATAAEVAERLSAAPDAASGG